MALGAASHPLYVYCIPYIPAHTKNSPTHLPAEALHTPVSAHEVQHSPASRQALVVHSLEEKTSGFPLQCSLIPSTYSTPVILLFYQTSQLTPPTFITSPHHNHSFIPQ